MNEKKLKIIIPNIRTIADTIDMLHKVDNGRSPTAMVDSITNRYWIINSVDKPDEFSLFTTDILVSDIIYNDDVELYNSLKKKYNDIINKFIHKEFDFGKKFIDIISSMIDKENVDQLTIILYHDESQLRRNIINLLLNNTELNSIGKITYTVLNPYISEIIICRIINTSKLLEV